MALTFAATGATSYQYRPATPQENTPRVILEIAVAGIMAEAMVDTGGVYLLCHPRLARQEEEGWNDMPSILGFYGCLERIRMAIDPVTETFYFGSTG
jgi:hypothetical protein